GPRCAPVRRPPGRSARGPARRAGKCQRDHRAVVRSLADQPRREPMMAASRESERALLLRVARQAMVDHGLEPDFPPAALTEAGSLSARVSPDGVARDL